MKIALIGAAGNIGRRILDEALHRGHQVTAIQRDPAKLTHTHINLTVVQGDLAQPASLPALFHGHDVVISAASPADSESFIQINKDLVEAVRLAQVPRVLIVGGAGCLEVAPGVDLLQSGALDSFPWKWVAEAHREVRNHLREIDGVNWTYFSPAGLIEAGERTGKFRLGTTALVADEAGKSRISMEDYAVALIDELENPQFHRAQFTIGY